VRILLSVCLLTAVAACQSKEIKRYQEFPPRPANTDIEVWMGTSAPADLANSVPDHKLGRPPRGVKVIGEISIDKSTTWGWSEVIEETKRDAREMGGDGIIVEHDRGSLVTTPSVKALVFRFPDSQPTEE